MSKLFKVMKSDKLTNAEYLTYSVICCYTDKSNICKATRETICRLTGIKKSDTITKHTNKLEKLGLIEKIHSIKNKKKFVEYKVKIKDSEFMIMTNELFGLDLTPSELGLYIRLASFRVFSLDYTTLSKNELIKRLKLNKSTFYKTYNKYLELGLIEEFENKIIFNRNIVPAYDIMRLSSNRQDEMKEILANKDKYPIKIYNQIKDYCEKKLYYCTTANKMFDNIMSGFVKNNKI